MPSYDHEILFFALLSIWKLQQITEVVKEVTIFCQHICHTPKKEKQISIGGLLWFIVVHVQQTSLHLFDQNLTVLYFCADDL